MNLLRPVFILIILSLTSCRHQLVPEHKTLFIDGGVDDEQIEILHGAVKEVLIGDSVKADNFNHIYFDQKGNMIHANAKYVSYHDTVYRKVVYKSEYDKAGNKVSLRAAYSVYPDSCGCNGGLKWIFDSKGHVIKSISDQIRFDHTIDYQYDTTGRIKYKDVWGKEVSSDRYYYKYDANNHLIQLDSYEMDWNNKKPASSLSTTSFKYLAFDSHNNWIKMADGADTITRKITYYPNP